MIGSRGSRLGPYELAASIGAGGMGEVYRARDTRLGRDVAIKVLPVGLSRDPDRIRRFEQEARAAGALNHPNVCTIYDVGTHDGAPYVVMELLEGESLRDRISSGPIPLRKALDYASQIARGLAAAHDKGIVHRDLKPANVFVTKDGRVKVLDFGLAKLTGPEAADGSGETTATVAGTEEGVRLGTVGYMAPEQVRGERADHCADVFALGAILYELLTGKRAFHGETYVETLNAILNEEPVLAGRTVASGKEMPPALELIVRRCLEKLPEQRFQSARDLAFDLETVSGISTGASVARDAQDVRPRRSRSKGMLATLFAITAVASAALTHQFTSPKQSIDPARIKFTRLTHQRFTGLVSARFAPDGKSVYFSASVDGRPREVHEVRPGMPGSVPLSLPGNPWLWSVSDIGMLLVSLESQDRSSTLAEVPITGGIPRKLLDGIGGADWGADGRTLAIVRYLAGKCLLEMPPGQILRESAGQMTIPRISPDGRHIAFLDAPSGLQAPAAQIVILDTTGRVIAQTREPWSSLSTACWSAAGSEVWFVASTDDNNYDLRALALDGRERLVFRFDAIHTPCDISPDGRVLLVTTSSWVGIRGAGGGTQEDRELGWRNWSYPADISSDGKTLLFTDWGQNMSVCIRGMDGSSPVRLGEGKALTLSPDGRWALALRSGPPARLVLLPTGAGDTLSLPAGDIETFLGARWIPDGRRILVTGSARGEAARSRIQEISGGLPGPPMTPVGCVVSAVSPDGREVAFVGEDGQLFIRSLESDDVRSVAQLSVAESVHQWTADGRSLFVGEASGEVYRLSRLDIRSGKRVPWKTLRNPHPTDLPFLDVQLTTDGRAYAYGYRRAASDFLIVEGLR